MLVILAAVAVVLAIVLPHAGEAKDAQTAESAQEQAEDLPLDTSFVVSDSQSEIADQTDPAPEASPNIDPGTGMELEEDELPIMTP